MLSVLFNNRKSHLLWFAKNTMAFLLNFPLLQEQAVLFSKPFILFDEINIGYRWKIIRLGLL